MEKFNQDALTQKEYLLKEIINVVDTMCQISLEILSLLVKNNDTAILNLLTDLDFAITHIMDAQKPVIDMLEHAYTQEMLENIQDTVMDIRISLQRRDMERAAVKAEFQLFLFLRQLKEAFYFWGLIYPDKAKMDRYYREEFADHYKDYYVSNDEKSEYQLSIIVPAYNHLETTKKCIEQLLKVTDFEKLNAELILIDHGSTDGTLEYFESLGVKKVIHFKHNVRAYMQAFIPLCCEARYFSFISNDVLVTKDWAELLLTSFNLDSTLACVIPSMPNLSNYQTVNTDIRNPEEFIKWANNQNKLDPSMWQDRARLMPAMSICDILKTNKIGYADPLFYSFEFWDDDFSLRIRRSGFRQIICQNVACFHYGSVTAKSIQKSDNTLHFGRKLFQIKSNVDPWSNDFCYDYNMVQIVQQTFVDQACILCIDGGFGDTALQIKNIFRHNGKVCDIFHITQQKEFKQDLCHACSKIVVADEGRIAERICEFEKQKFSHIIINRPLEHYPDFKYLLKMVKCVLSPAGYVIFRLTNPYCILQISNLLNFELFKNNKYVSFIDPQEVEKILNSEQLTVNILEEKFDVKGADEFRNNLWGEEKAEKFKDITSVSNYYYICRFKKNLT